MICKQRPETVGHALWTCPAATGVWSSSLPKLQKMSYNSESFMDAWAEWIEKLTREELSMAATTVRLI